MTLSTRTKLLLVSLLPLAGVGPIFAQPTPRPTGPMVGGVDPPNTVHPKIGLRIRTDVKFDAVPLVDALDFLATHGRMNMVVNWSALELAGIDRNMPVTLNLKAVNIVTALRMIARGVSDQLAFDVDDNILIVSTRDLVDARQVTRIYPIDDLLSTVPNFVDAPQFSLTTRSGSGGGGGGQGLFGQGQGGGDGQARELELSRTERAQQIVALIQATVEPDVWDVNGGRASIRYFAGNLIMTGPARVHGLFR